jgi:hypothetical protein
LAKQQQLVFHELLDKRPVRIVNKILMELDFTRPFQFCVQSILGCPKPEIVLMDLFISGFRCLAVQPEEHIAFFDELPFVHPHFGNYATLAMLHDLTLCGDANRSLAGYALVKRGYSKPEKKSPEPDDKNPYPETDRATGISLQLSRFVSTLRRKETFQPVLNIE